MSTGNVTKTLFILTAKNFMQKDLPTGCIKFLVTNFNTSSRKITGMENNNTAFHSAQFNGVTRKMAYKKIKTIPLKC